MDTNQISQHVQTASPLKDVCKYVLLSPQTSAAHVHFYSQVGHVTVYSEMLTLFLTIDLTLCVCYSVTKH